MDPAGTSAMRSRWRRLPPLGRFRYSTIELLVALIILLVTAPFIEVLPAGAFIESVLMTAVMVSAVLAVGGTRRSLMIALLLAIPSVLARWLAFGIQDASIPVVVQTAPVVIFFGYVISRILRAIHDAPRVDSSILCAGLSAYLMLGLAWAALYQAVSSLAPGSFTLNGALLENADLSSFHLIYYSFTTLTTLGLGDIVPVTPAARMLTMLEATTGVLFVAVLLARLVAMHSPNPPTTP